MSQPVDELNFSKFGVTQVGDMDKQITRKAIKRLNNIYPEVRTQNVEKYTMVAGIYSGSQHDSNTLEQVSGTRGSTFRTFYRNADTTAPDQYHYFHFPIPIYKGKYTLVPDSLFLDMITANGANYVDVITVYGVNKNGITVTIHDDGTNRTDDTNVDLDLNENRYAFFKDYSDFVALYVQLDLRVNTANFIEFAAPVLRYYYKDKNPIGETIDRI